MPAYSPFLTGILNQQPAQQTGQNLAALAALAAIQPYLTWQPKLLTSVPSIPQYSGPTSTGALAGSLMGKSPQPQPAAPGTAGTSLLNNPQLAGLLQQFFKNQNGNGPANTPGNNYYYGLSGGQGNPSIYGSGGLRSLFGGSNPYAGMGAPT